MQPQGIRRAVHGAWIFLRGNYSAIPDGPARFETAPVEGSARGAILALQSVDSIALTSSLRTVEPDGRLSEPEAIAIDASKRSAQVGGFDLEFTPAGAGLKLTVVSEQQATT